MSARPSRMAEDYVTLIWKAYEWPGGAASTTDLAVSLGVTPSTVSANLKKLARDGPIAYEPYGSIALTEAGRTIAVAVVRRHRLIETYLVRRLGLSWDQVHDEADRLEHSVGELVLDAMDAALGHPTADPHGDPIPADDGTVPTIDTWSLAEAPIGRAVMLRRVSDRDADVLRYLETKSIGIGSIASVEARSRGAGTMTLRIAGASLELTLAVAAVIRVSPADAAEPARDR